PFPTDLRKTSLIESYGTRSATVLFSKALMVFTDARSQASTACTMFCTGETICLADSRAIVLIVHGYCSGGCESKGRRGQNHDGDQPFGCFGAGRSEDPSDRLRPSGELHWRLWLSARRPAEIDL